MTNEEATQLAHISTMVNDMHYRLFGNGQPGELAVIKSRVDDLEASRDKVRGILWVLSGLSAVFGSLHIKDWLGGH